MRYTIDELDETPVFERCESFGMGLDGYTRSTLLDPNAFQYGKNTVVPDGMELRTRPGCNLIGTNRGARIQGLAYFDTPAVEQLLAGYNAGLGYWDGLTWTAIAGFAFDNAALDFSAAQGVDKLLITDGTSQMQLWDGAAISGPLGNGPADPPVGATLLVWHASRMFAMGFPGGTVAGKENDAVCISNLLDFGSGAWDLTDRSLRIGVGDGDRIVGAASLTSSFDKGYALVIGKANSIWIINTDPTAQITNWTATIGPEQVSDGIGFVGPRAYAVVVNDLYFVSPDHTFRSLARMEAAAGQYRVGEALSLPIQSWTDRINWAHADKIVVMKYKELALFSVPLDAATTPNYVFAFNCRLQKWVGIWTGWTANSFDVTRFNNVHRLAFGQEDGAVREFTDFSSVEDDASYLDDGAAIPTEVWSRAFLFGEPLNTKDALHCEIRFGQSNALVTATLVADDVEIFSWLIDARADVPQLEINLEFDLVADGNRAFSMGLRDLIAFNECYIKLTASAGWFSVRNISMSAFVNALQTT